MLCETRSSGDDDGVGDAKMYAVPGKFLCVFGLEYHLFVLCDLNHLEFSVIYLHNFWRNILLASCFLIFKHQIYFAFCVVLHVLISWQLNSGSMDIQTCMKKQQLSASMLSVFASVSELFEIVVYLCKHSFLLYHRTAHSKERTETRLL